MAREEAQNKLTGKPRPRIDQSRRSFRVSDPAAAADEETSVPPTHQHLRIRPRSSNSYLESLLSSEGPNPEEAGGVF